MKLIFVNGFELEVESIFSIGEVRTIVDDPSFIATIIENLSDTNLRVVTLSHQEEEVNDNYYDVTCTNLVVTEFNPSELNYTVTIHLREKTETELYAEVGRILMGGGNEYQDN